MPSKTKNEIADALVRAARKLRAAKSPEQLNDVALQVGEAVDDIGQLVFEKVR